MKSIDKIAGKRSTLVTVCSVVSVLISGFFPSNASAERRRSRERIVIAVMDARGGERDMRKDLTRKLRRELQRSGARVVPKNRLGKARSNSPQGLARAGRRSGADYVLDVSLASSSELSQGEAGVFMVSRHTANAKLVDAKTGKIKMRFRSQTRGREAATRSGRRIAKETMEKLEALSRRETRRERRRERRREAREVRRERREAESNRAESRSSARAIAVRNETRGEAREEARFSESFAESTELRNESGGELRDEVEREEGEGSSMPLSAELGLDTFVGGLNEAGITVGPELEIAEELALFVDASLSYDPTEALFEGVGDVGFGLRIEEILSGVEGELAVEFPTSADARGVGNILTSVVGVGVEGEWGRWKPALEFEAKKFFPTISPTEVGMMPEENGEMEAEAEEPGFCSTTFDKGCPFLGEVPPNFLVGASLAVEYKLPWIAGLDTKVRVGYELVQFIESEQNIEGEIQLGYDLNRRWKGVIGMLTISPLSNSSLIFPFYNFSGPAAQHTTVYAGLRLKLGALEAEESRE